jgi:hypothetical protein
MSDQQGRGAYVAPWWAEDFAAGLRAMGIEALAWFDGVVTTPGRGWVVAPREAGGQWTAHVGRGRRYPTALEALVASLRGPARAVDGKASAEIAILVAAAKAIKPVAAP